MAKPITLTKNNFQKEILDAKIPCLVDFWASWCGPCKMIAPAIDELAGTYEGKVKIGKVNTEEEPELTAEYRVISIPTLIFFKDGKPVDQIIGAVPKAEIVKKIDTLL